MIQGMDYERITSYFIGLVTVLLLGGLVSARYNVLSNGEDLALTAAGLLILIYAVGATVVLSFDYLTT